MKAKETQDIAIRAASGEEVIKPETGLDVLEDAGVAYNPTRPLDLSVEEKRRTTSLMLAVQAYKDQLIPDAGYLQTAADLARRGEGPSIRPATIDAVVVAAIKFDLFIAGAARKEDFEPREVGTEKDAASGL